MGNRMYNSSPGPLAEAVFPTRAKWEGEYKDKPEYALSASPHPGSNTGVVIASTPDWDRDETVRVVCTSDTHNSLRCKRRDKGPGEWKEDMPPGDILVHCGDFTNLGRPKDIKIFARWLESQPHKHKVVIAGNHDLTLDESMESNQSRRYGATDDEEGQGGTSWVSQAKELKEEIGKHCVLLEDSSATVSGLRFHGSPWTPAYRHGWGYNLPRGSGEIKEKWREIPTDTDVLLTHGPPLGVLDLCGSGDRAGCEHLLEEVTKRIKPKLHVFGHIHEGHGVLFNRDTAFVNATMLDSTHWPKNAPVVMDVKKRIEKNEEEEPAMETQ